MKPKSRLRKEFLVPLLFLIAFITIPRTAMAQNTYEEKSGRFAIDLPDGYKIAKSEGNHYVFTVKNGPDIRLIFVPKAEGIINMEVVAFKGAVDGIKNTMAKNPPPTFELKKMGLNGNPAFFGISKGQYAAESGMKFELISLIGSVALKDGAVNLMCMSTASKRKELEPLIHKSFYTLRNPGTAVTGATNVTEIKEADLSTP